MTQRIENPHYGMVVTDLAKVFMLIRKSYPHDPRGDNSLVWQALRLDIDAPADWAGRNYQLLLDHDVFAEVSE